MILHECFKPAEIHSFSSFMQEEPMNVCLQWMIWCMLKIKLWITDDSLWHRSSCIFQTYYIYFYMKLCACWISKLLIEEYNMIWWDTVLVSLAWFSGKRDDFLSCIVAGETLHWLQKKHSKGCFLLRKSCAYPLRIEK